MSGVILWKLRMSIPDHELISKSFWVVSGHDLRRPGTADPSAPLRSGRDDKRGMSGDIPKFRDRLKLLLLLRLREE